MRDKLISKAIMKCYEVMYNEAEPSADIHELISMGKTKKPNWFMDYYLSEERQEEIISQVAKEFKLTKREKESLHVSVLLGSAPSATKKE